jgi:hypothetical protein
VPRPSLANRRRDPFWDLDGAGARRARSRARIQRSVVWIVALAILAFGLSRLPAVDPAFLIDGGGRPILAAALMTLLGSAALLALARVRHVSRH